MAVTIVGQALAHFAVRRIVASVLTCVKSSLGPLGFGLVVIELCESSHTLRKPLPAFFGTCVCACVCMGGTDGAPD